MQTGAFYDQIPLWGIFLITVVLILASIEGGLRVGAYRRKKARSEDKPPVGEMVAATLGLLAFLLAFTFGMAASRFDTRRSLVVDEANAIGTTFLRAGLIDEPHRSQVRGLLREYVDARIVGGDRSKLAQSLERSTVLHEKLWSHAEAVGRKDPGSIVVGLFITSLNETIDLHTKRLTFGLRTRIPWVIWVTLYLVSILGMSVIGYHAGLAGSGRSIAMLAVLLSFAAVLTLIADLDRSQEGLLRVSQQPLIDVQTSMNPTGG